MSKCDSDICTDNRFEVIAEYKQKLIEGTTIDTSPKEMEVLDNILFRMWQMGWIPKIDITEIRAEERAKTIEEFRKLLEPLDDYVIDGGKLVGLKLGDCFDDIVNQLAEMKEQK